MRGEEKKEENISKRTVLTQCLNQSGLGRAGEEGSGSSMKSGSQWWGLHSKTPWDVVGTGLDLCK